MSILLASEYVDKLIAEKIISDLGELSFDDVHKVSKKSGITVQKLQDFVDGDEKITVSDSVKLISTMSNLL